MSEMSENSKPEPVERVSTLRRFVVYAGVPLAAFLLGFLPMWIRSQERGRNLAAAEQQFSRARVQNNLASAAIGARRGDYEPARRHFKTGSHQEERSNVRIYDAGHAGL